MINSIAPPSRKPQQLTVVLASVVAAMALLGGLVLTPAAKAGVETPICGVTLAPYGQSGDRCWGPSQQRLLSVWVSTSQRSGCVTYASPSNELQDSWYCVGSGTSAGKYVRNDGGYHKAVVRNNNLTYSGWFGGKQICCY